MSGHGSLLEGLGEGRVSVAGSGNVLGRGTVLQSQSTLSNHLTGVGTNDVDTQQAVGLGISNHLDQTLGIQVGLGSGVGAEGEGSDSVRDLLILEVLLGLANPSNLRVGVHDGGDGSVVDVAVTLLDVLDNGDGLLLSLVGKHGAEGGITNTSDVGDLGSVLGVDDNTAALVDLEANVLKAKASGVGSSANGNKNDIGLNLQNC